ncbi:MULTISPECIES: helix-turn-helix transcriptional regulator [Brevibacterium]|nr:MULTISPECIES: helix-turn-helix transcriptional regulator [Brevibacterium]
MDVSTQVREFLMSRRAKVTPEMAGLPRGGGLRRVPGLRREEVATLAGVSADYYTQIERGDVSGASDEIIEAIASALLLDEIELGHLHSLVRASRRQRSRGRTRPLLPPNARRIIDAMSGIPAIVQNDRLDVVAANSLGRGLFAMVFEFALEAGDDEPNYAKFVFLDDRAKDLYADWDAVAEDVVSALRRESVRYSNSPLFTSLIGQLSTSSPEFRQLWAKQDVNAYRRGRKVIRHPIAGELALDYEVMVLPGTHQYSIVTYLPEPGSASEEALRFLASWDQHSHDAEAQSPKPT